MGYTNAVQYCDKIIVDTNKILKKYGSKSKNLKGKLEYILKRDR